MGTALDILKPPGARPVCTAGDPENGIKPDPRGEMTYVKSNGTLGQLQTMEASTKSDKDIKKDAAKIERQLMCQRNPIACSQDPIPIDKAKADLFMEAEAGPFYAHGRMTPQGVETWSFGADGKWKFPRAEMGFENKIKNDPVRATADKMGVKVIPLKKRVGVAYGEYKAGEYYRTGVGVDTKVLGMEQVRGKFFDLFKK